MCACVVTPYSHVCTVTPREACENSHGLESGVRSRGGIHRVYRRVKSIFMQSVRSSRQSPGKTGQKQSYLALSFSHVLS